MTDTIDDAGPAFPSHGSMGEVAQQGMSLRDYFAAKTMQAFIREYFDANGRCMGMEHPYSNIPHHAYRMADAMIKVREKK